MSFYRYALETPDYYTRSLTPITEELKNFTYYSYRFYTSLNDNNNACRVISLGYEKSWPMKVWGPRQVNRFNVRYVTRGKAFFNGQPVSEGQFFFSTAHDTYAIECTDEPFEFYYIGISGNGTEDIIKSAGFHSIPKIGECPFINEIPGIFYEPLFISHVNKDVDLYLLSRFLYLMSLHKPYNSIVSNISDTAQVYYQQALNYIQEYLCEGITPKDIAEFLHISPSYLRSIFGKNCEYSLREYLIRKRVEYAADQLRFKRCSVKEAANAVGYEDCSQFCKMFKKYIGMPPQTYKTMQTRS
ncbi:MAG: helix-turn-helix domain-containing protein [Eubacteriales bacterium]